jgi:hypothetical protein
MKPLLSFSLVTLTLAGPLIREARAGDPGWGGYPASRCSNCADSKFQTPRYFQVMPLRHYEDRKRYNAAPCCGEPVRTDPYLVKTVIVSKRRLPHYTYDAHGNRVQRNKSRLMYLVDGLGLAGYRDAVVAAYQQLAEAIDCDTCPVHGPVGGEKCKDCADRLIAWARGVVDEIGGR